MFSMLNSFIISESESEPLDKFCEEYNQVSLQIKDLTKTKDSANKGIKTYCTHKGLFETPNFAISMTEIEGDWKLDTKKTEEYLKKYHEDIWAELVKNCMKYSEGYVKLVSVKKK